jgi:outer membrane receptor for ferrienterochelin and colicin
VDDRVWIRNGSWGNNSSLEQSYIHNYDLRVEWYPQPGEVLSVSYFHKQFIKPVEMVMRELSDGQNFELHNMNLDRSTANGFELNWRKGLEFISPALRDLYFTGNYTWMEANVKYNQQELFNPNITDSNPEFDRDRPLQGLSPYALNVGMAYEGKVIGAAVNYNRVGRKLVLAGEFEKYDQYENPRNVLDLQLSARFLRKQRLEVKVNASDLLSEDVIVYRNCGYDIKHDGNTEPDKGYTGRTALGMDYNEGDWVMSRFRKGVNLSISASYKF